MIGQLQYTKQGRPIDGTLGGSATGWYNDLNGNASGFCADPKSPNGSPGNLWDAVSVPVPGSGLGPDTLPSFSAIASGAFGGTPAGNYIFNLCICVPLPALTAEILSQYRYGPPLAWLEQYARNNPQFLPLPAARASGTVVASSLWSVEADVTNSGGVLSGTFAFDLDGVTVESGSLVNLPQNLNQPIAVMLQIAQQPPESIVNTIVIGVSTANGYTGTPQELNL